ncbi:hypothetical protein C475_06170 [Halosimplex carlsbadense 2-9-1]|uniref:DUF7344 domain-containing protein n=1 Tax=Halosimplex carlsbadense 2-9-1 TaxID=797114 RepID=M0CYI3_9EURY|nr:hypothetical protein [Halosimplex carlsbadense]ELZ27482.1 hypothetical protein C475_06170 [Halosimplex carlsbadense 2-9-1]
MSQTTSRTTDDGRTVIDLSADERHELLAAQRRRVALAVLAERAAPTELDDLARAVAAREGEDPPAEAVERLAVSLHHVHLPRMDELGVVDYDPSANRVDTVRALATA